MRERWGDSLAKTRRPVVPSVLFKLAWLEPGEGVSPPLELGEEGLGRLSRCPRPRGRARGRCQVSAVWVAPSRGPSPGPLTR